MVKLLKRKAAHVELRVLLVVPDAANVDSDPEIAYLTSLRHIRVQVLPGHISARALYDAVDDKRYRQHFDIIHFAVHSSADPPLLSLNGDKLRPEDIGQVSRRAGASLLFFNSCNSGVLASYVVQRGVTWAIYLNRDLVDKEAWKMPLLFYESLDNQIDESGTYSIPKAFRDAVPGDGTYGITSDYDRAGILTVQREIETLRRWVVGLFVAGVFHSLVLMGIVAWLLWGWQ